MASPFLAVINEKTKTLVNAIVNITVANSIIVFFTSLNVLSNLLSFFTLFIFSLVVMGLLVRRYYIFGETSDFDRNKIIRFLALILLASMAMSIYRTVSEHGRYGYIVTVVIWFLATLGLQLSVKQARKPKVRGTPLVPWLPSASIAINVFIMGSIDGASFVRFSVWSVFLLAYYLFVGLHASYDASKDINREEIDQEAAAAQAAIVKAGVTVTNAAGRDQNPLIST